MEDLFFEHENFNLKTDVLPAEQDASIVVTAIVTIGASIIGSTVGSCVSRE